MVSRSNVRTNAIAFSILGVVVGLLIHFIVLSSPRYNWIDPVLVEPEALVNTIVAGLSCCGLM